MASSTAYQRVADSERLRNNPSNEAGICDFSEILRCRGDFFSTSEFKFILIAATVFSGCCSSDQAGTDTGYDLTLEVDRQTVEVGSHIMATVLFSNFSSKSIEIGDSILAKSWEETYDDFAGSYTSGGLQRFGHQPKYDLWKSNSMYPFLNVRPVSVDAGAMLYMYPHNKKGLVTVKPKQTWRGQVDLMPMLPAVNGKYTLQAIVNQADEATANPVKRLVSHEVSLTVVSDKSSAKQSDVKDTGK